MSSFSLDSLSALTSNVQSQAVSSSADALKTKLTNASSETTEEELMDACKEFETYLVEQVMKEVTKSVNLFGEDESSDAGMSTMMDYYKDSFVQEISSTISENSNLGIAQQLYESMKRNYDL